MRKLCLGLSFVAMAILVACGSGSGTGTGPAQVGTINDLGECGTSNEGVTKLVTSENQYYKCVDGDWEETEAPIQNSPFAGGGILKDSRDGQTYKTVQIGDQVWMAENLNYETEGSYCYDDVKSNCAKYGRLYIWEAATSACPSGWHLPSQGEFETLLEFVGGEDVAGTKLKFVSGWRENGNGEDAFGFSALPAGGRGVNGNYDGEGYGAFFWSSTELSSSGGAWGLYLDYDYGHVYLDRYINPGFSVRCLKDAGVGQEETTTRDDSSSSNENVAIVDPSTVVTDARVVDPSTVVTGTITDERDGQTYRTVNIGNQLWMAENLNYRYLGPTAGLDSSSFCYDDNPANCTKYGRLYLWSAAMDSAGIVKGNSANGCGYYSKCSPGETVRGVCPKGWHLPSRAEWETLIVAVDGSIVEYDWDNMAGVKLKSSSGWYSSGNGTDAFGFSALPAGYGDNNGDYYYEDYYARFWSSSEINSNIAYSMYLYYNNDYAFLYDNYKDYGTSVRCLKD